MKYFWIISLLVLPSLITLFNNGECEMRFRVSIGPLVFETFNFPIRRGRSEFASRN